MTVNGVAPVEVSNNEDAGWETERDKEDGGFIDDHDFSNPKIPLIEIRPGPKLGPQHSRLTDLIETGSAEGPAPQNTVLEDIEESRRRVFRESNQSRVLSPHSTRRYMISQENKKDDLRKALVWEREAHQAKLATPARPGRRIKAPPTNLSRVDADFSDYHRRGW